MFYCFSWLVWREILVFLFKAWLWEKAKNSSLSVGGGGLLLTAAATADEKILLREDWCIGLTTWKSFLWSRSNVSRSAPLDWVNFSESRSLSCFNLLFSSIKAWNWLKSERQSAAVADRRSRLEKGSEQTKSTPKSGLDKSVATLIDLVPVPPRDEEEQRCFRGEFSEVLKSELAPEAVQCLRKFVCAFLDVSHFLPERLLQKKKSWLKIRQIFQLTRFQTWHEKKNFLISCYISTRLYI